MKLVAPTATTLALLLACSSDAAQQAPAEESGSAETVVNSNIAPPIQTGPAPEPIPTATPSTMALAVKARCPADMVLVGEELCVDRFEASLVDARSESALSPYWPPDGPKATYVAKIWGDLKGTGTTIEQSMALPTLPPWQRERGMKPKAISRKGMVPQAYASGKDATLACENAGKRLCTRDEWKKACRGETNRDFPYGEKYERGKCNVVRDTHPGVVLWENPSINHTDPRFNLITDKQGPLLRKTGATATCLSTWGDDAIYDMVGNVDEWIDDPEGTFVGAFYARGRKDGCQAGIDNHVFAYADYSTGIRCCKAAERR